MWKLRIYFPNLPKVFQLVFFPSYSTIVCNGKAYTACLPAHLLPEVDIPALLQVRYHIIEHFLVDLIFQPVYDISDQY